MFRHVSKVARLRRRGVPYRLSLVDRLSILMECRRALRYQAWMTGWDNDKHAGMSVLRQRVKVVLNRMRMEDAA